MKIAYVNSICVQHDAISQSIDESMRCLARRGHALQLYTYQCAMPDLPHRIVRHSTDVLLDPFFRGADVVAFHFGIFNPMLNLIFALPSRTRSLVRFHNVTPKEFVAPMHHAIIDRSLQQLPNLRWADHVVCDSATNRRVLVANAINAPSSILPLTVEAPLPAPSAKPSHEDGIVRIVFIGRFVRSKGCTDLVESVRRAAIADPDRPYRLDLIGNLVFAETEVVDQMRRFVSASPSNLDVTLHTDASDEVKWQILRDADLFVLPTYHEGFCVPIVEALAGGCKVVTYDNSNLPAICGGLAHLVPTGDVNALALAILEQSRVLRSSRWIDGDYAIHAGRCRCYEADFSRATFGRRLVALFQRLVDEPRGRHRQQP